MSGEKPYVCTVPGCGKSFTEYSSLYKHHVVHTHCKPYTCSHCGKTYRQTSTLAMHRRTTHGDFDTADDGETPLSRPDRNDNNNTTPASHSSPLCMCVDADVFDASPQAAAEQDTDVKVTMETGSIISSQVCVSSLSSHELSVCV